MQITYWVNKLGAGLVFLFLSLGAVGSVFADGETSWVSHKDGRVHLEMADGTNYGLKLLSGVGRVFYDKGKHQIAERSYVSLFQVSPSNSARPTGLCGAGSEVWLYVYQVTEATLSEKKRVLVSSCLYSISMLSQNSGEEAQDFDFSSVQWNAQGFSIDWFQNVDAVGQPLDSTNFVLRDDAFLSQDVLSKESHNN
jgi:hypothetical protein